MSIRDWSEKIKSASKKGLIKVRNALGGNSELYTGAIIILVGLSSFGLGRLSVLEEKREPIIIENNFQRAERPLAPVGGATGSQTTLQTAGVGSSVQGGKLVASKNGTKYYFPWCGSNIAEKNKVWFNSEAEARAKGYTPAANCKGLR